MRAHMPRCTQIIIIHSNEPYGAHCVLCLRALSVEFLKGLWWRLETGTYAPRIMQKIGVYSDIYVPYPYCAAAAQEAKS